MKTSEIEVKLPEPFYHINQLLTQILKDIKLLPSEEEMKVQQLQLCIDTIK